MKIKSITLQNYKRFVEPKTISFCNPEGEINNKILLVGNNGTGKSSVLQAIVMLVASATREQFTPDSLDWAGFEYRLIAKKLGSRKLKMEVELIFTNEEIETAYKYAEMVGKDYQGDKHKKEKNNIHISLDYQNHRVLADESDTRFYHVLQSHQYANLLASETPNKRMLFEKIGNIYWYDEQRSSYTSHNLMSNEKPNIDFMRNFLANAYSYHIALQRGEAEMQAGEFDFYEKLESLYKTVFPSHAFLGARPRFDIYEKAKAPDFFLSDGKNQYEIGEMSAGERAIFPILMDFARWNINNSIIIIDEVELHLHPPLQQGLVRVLEKLGNNNQFILTTHSDDVAFMFDETENELIRLKYA